MELYDELIARGLIAQVTDEEEIKELINTGKATFYIGLFPAICSLFIRHNAIKCPTWRLSAVGSKPI